MRWVLAAGRQTRKTAADKGDEEGLNVPVKFEGVLEGFGVIGTCEGVRDG